MSKIKGFLTGMGGIIFLVLLITIEIFALNWYEVHFEGIYSWLIRFGSISFWIFILSLLASLIPRARKYSGNLIVICSWVWGLGIWLTNLYISGVTVGNIWTIIATCFLGFGVFVSAGIGLLINGQVSDLFLMILSLVLVYIVRLFGYFIVSKEPLKNDLYL